MRPTSLDTDNLNTVLESGATVLDIMQMNSQLSSQAEMLCSFRSPKTHRAKIFRLSFATNVFATLICFIALLLCTIFVDVDIKKYC